VICVAEKQCVSSEVQTELLNIIVFRKKRPPLRPLVREGAQQRQHSKIQTELISGRKSKGGLDAKTY
jgi:hypothetical protein